MRRPPKILVFDSGAGCLSIAEEILARLPHCHMACAADNAYFPYGLKEDAALTARIVCQVEQLHERFSPDIVVVACNTASTLALDALRQEFSTPFVGVVPAIKPAANITRSGTIGVLATAATTSRGYTRNLIDNFASRHKVVLHATDTLVDLAEIKLIRSDVDLAALESELEPLFIADNNIDTLVLACTHFPLLKDDMSSIFKRQRRQVVLVDSGEAIANRVVYLLGQKDVQVNQPLKKPGVLEFFFSDSRRGKAIESQYRRYLASAAASRRAH